MSRPSQQLLIYSNLADEPSVSMPIPVSEFPERSPHTRPNILLYICPHIHVCIDVSAYERNHIYIHKCVCCVGSCTLCFLAIYVDTVYAQIDRSGWTGLDLEIKSSTWPCPQVWPHQVVESELSDAIRTISPDSIQDATSGSLGETKSNLMILALTSADPHCL